MKKLLLSLIFIPILGHSAVISHTDYTDGSVITAAGQNANENRIFNDYNGNIDNTNIKAGGIVASNIQSASIDATRFTSTVQAQLLPSGVILPYVANTAPTGFLECDGSAISRATYASLFAVIGTNYGQGDNSTTFNVPDMRGYFMRGWDHGAGHDTNAGRRPITTGGATGDNIGSFQVSSNSVTGIALTDPGHNHTNHTWTNSGVNGGHPFGTNSGTEQGASPATDGNTLNTTGITLSGQTETVPKNVNVMYIIKT